MLLWTQKSEVCNNGVARKNSCCFRVRMLCVPIHPVIIELRPVAGERRRASSTSLGGYVLNLCFDVRRPRHFSTSGFVRQRHRDRRRVGRLPSTATGWTILRLNIATDTVNFFARQKNSITEMLTGFFLRTYLISPTQPKIASVTESVRVSINLKSEATHSNVES